MSFFIPEPSRTFRNLTELARLPPAPTNTGLHWNLHLALHRTFRNLRLPPQHAPNPIWAEDPICLRCWEKCFQLETIDCFTQESSRHCCQRSLGATQRCNPAPCASCIAWRLGPSSSRLNDVPSLLIADPAVPLSPNGNGSSYFYSRFLGCKKWKLMGFVRIVSLPL